MAEGSSNRVAASTQPHRYPLTIKKLPHSPHRLGALVLGIDAVASVAVGSLPTLALAARAPTDLAGAPQRVLEERRANELVEHDDRDESRLQGGGVRLE